MKDQWPHSIFRALCFRYHNGRPDLETWALDAIMNFPGSGKDFRLWCRLHVDATWFTARELKDMLELDERFFDALTPHEKRTAENLDGKFLVVVGKMEEAG